MQANYQNVTLTGGFWKAKEDLNRDVTIDAVYNRFDETGRIAAFRCDWKDGMPYRPHIFWDSDVAKWMEGAAYQLSRDDNPALRAKVESLIDEIEKNQHPDGYFNIYYTVVDPAHRFTNRDNHELYCAGHLIEAAVAYHDAVGDTRFLGLMEKYARYIKAVFMDGTAEPKPKFATPGHEEIELALVKLWHATGEAEYLDLAAFFIDRRGYGDRGEPLDTSNQSHMPLREQRSVVGHSVRAGYIYAAMADLAREKNDAALDEACCALFEDMAYRKMYVTGGLGSTNVGEAFTIPYDLSNDKAYAETCASIAMILFAHRMFLLHHASKYADVVELELYNGMLSGLSLSGDAFFYENPLEIHLDNYKKQGGRYPITQRRKIFDCSCCPCNINRVLASVGQYFYAEENGAVWISQFGTSEYRSDACMVSQKTDYPVSGKIEITASCPVYVRIPGWCRSFTASAPYEMVSGYAKFAAGEITVQLELVPEYLVSHVGVYKNAGKVSLRRGPVIYCAEAIDNGGDVHSLFASGSAPAFALADSVPETGIPDIVASGYRRHNADPLMDSGLRLYAPLTVPEKFVSTEIRFIPYHAFANRGESNMLVWLPYRL